MAKDAEIRRNGAPLITFDDAHERLRHDPETGLLHWRTKPCKHIAEGDVAGTMANGYWRVKVGPHKYMAHRLIWFMTYGEWPDGQIDHISGNPSDNRLQNLRVVSQTENLRNVRLISTNRSGVTGVRWNYQQRRWRAYICVNNKSIYLGSFSDFDEAVSARKNAEAAHGFHPNHGRYVPQDT